jgi:hypothetical protein
VIVDFEIDGVAIGFVGLLGVVVAVIDVVDEAVHYNVVVVIVVNGYVEADADDYIVVVNDYVQADAVDYDVLCDVVYNHC